MQKQCPACKKINPPIDYDGGGWHCTISCANIIEVKSYLFGLIKVPKKCGYIASMDEEDSEWDYITTTKTEDMRFNDNNKNFNLNDVDDNVINLFNFHSYFRRGNNIILVPNTGQNITIHYHNVKDAKEVLEEILKRERLYAE